MFGLHIRENCLGNYGSCDFLSFEGIGNRQRAGGWALYFAVPFLGWWCHFRCRRGFLAMEGIFQGNCPRRFMELALLKPMQRSGAKYASKISKSTIIFAFSKWLSKMKRLLMQYMNVDTNKSRLKFK